MDVGTRIRLMRTAKKMTQGELAKRAGLTQNSVSLIELGQRSPKTDNLVRLADALGVEVVDLLGDDVSWAKVEIPDPEPEVLDAAGRALPPGEQYMSHISGVLGLIERLYGKPEPENSAVLVEPSGPGFVVWVLPRAAESPEAQEKR